MIRLSEALSALSCLSRRLSRTTPTPRAMPTKKRPVGKLSTKEIAKKRNPAPKAKKKPQYERLYLGKNMRYDPTPQKCECRRPWIDQEDGDRCNYCGKALDRKLLF